MNKTFAAVLLISASLAACGAKKETTTPANKDSATLEHKQDATGGAGYGGHKDEGGTTPKDTANPSSAK